MPDTELLRVLLPEIRAVHEKVDGVRDTQIAMKADVANLRADLAQRRRPCPDFERHAKEHPEPRDLAAHLAAAAEVAQEASKVKRTIRQAVLDAGCSVVKLLALSGAAAGLGMIGLKALGG